jgi:hypothetical protein
MKVACVLAASVVLLSMVGATEYRCTKDYLEKCTEKPCSNDSKWTPATDTVDLDEYKKTLKTKKPKTGIEKLEDAGTTDDYEEKCKLYGSSSPLVSGSERPSIHALNLPIALLLASGYNG